MGALASALAAANSAWAVCGDPG